MDPDSSEPEAKFKSTRPKLAGLDPRALMAEGLSPESGAPGTRPKVEIPGYEILRQLGTGGMGAVFLARQQSLDREIAIKVLHSGQEFATQFYDRLEREARAMATLSHPNIVPVHDFLRLSDGDAAIVMEAVDAGNLRDELRMAQGPLPVDRAIDLIRQISAGLGAAHKVGIVHRDMKPENVLITSDGTAKVTDFGIALPLDDDATRLTVTGTTLGTVAYMAPEQLNGDPVDARADVYSLGVMFYEMLTGTRPQGNFDSPDAVNPKIPKVTGEATLRALCSEPPERFQSVEEFCDALDAKHKLDRRLILTAAAGIAAVGGLGTAAHFAFRPRFTPLLSEIDLDAATIKGPWVHRGNGVASVPRDPGDENDQGIRILKLMGRLPPEGLDVLVQFTRLSGEDSVALFFRTSNGVGSAEVGAWLANYGGIGNLDDNQFNETPEHFEFPILNNQRYELMLKLRPGQAQVFLDGDLRLTVPMEGRDLTVAFPWEWEPEDDFGLAIGSWKSPTLFHRVAWREAPPQPE